MSTAHLKHWPPGLPPQLPLPRSPLFRLIEQAAERHPDKACTLFYDSALSYAEFRREAEALAGWLQAEQGLARGERVLLMMQNSPQWVLAYYAILRADAVVVPVNPMNREVELRHLVQDSGARLAIVAQDLLPEVQPLLGEAGLAHLLLACYRDHVRGPSALPLPDFVAAPPLATLPAGCTAWRTALAAGHRPRPWEAGPEDLAVMPYTSGTTGQPKACMHSHASAMASLMAGVRWFGLGSEAVFLSALPFFHVTGMVGSMNGPLFLGATLVILPRWDREAAAALIERHRVTVWQSIATMMVDFLAQPGLRREQLASLRVVRGGGAAMPAAVAARLKALSGLDYVEGYGMSETLAATHINPPQRPKPQCLGIPIFGVQARVVDPDTLAELPAGQAGEILVAGPQLMQGYWRQPEATAQSFVLLDGQRFLRTGDLGWVDEDGYFFMSDRLKRMINASGYKVWPAEVEALMYQHPAVQEACVIGVPDARRGETVKALVALRAGVPAPDEAALIAWCHAHMAAYKSPRLIEFVPSLPKSGSGKLMWRELQEQARQAATPIPDPQ